MQRLNTAQEKESLIHFEVLQSKGKSSNVGNDCVSMKRVKNILDSKNNSTRQKEITIHQVALENIKCEGEHHNMPVKIAGKKSKKNISKSFKHMSKSKGKMVGYPFPLMQEKMAIDEMKKFHISIKKNIKQCIVCFEASPVKDKVNLRNYMCTRCLRDSK